VGSEPKIDTEDDYARCIISMWYDYVRCIPIVTSGQ
jgi:hypothetical protein